MPTPLLYRMTDMVARFRALVSEASDADLVVLIRHHAYMKTILEDEVAGRRTVRLVRETIKETGDREFEQE